MTELRDRLQSALGASYRVERELGGGGMSRVFLAQEVRLGRQVVVKVLPPELADDRAPAYLRNRIEMQRGQLAEIDRGFGKTVLARIPELERDVTGLPMIERVAALMYGTAMLAPAAAAGATR